MQKSQKTAQQNFSNSTHTPTKQHVSRYIIIGIIITLFSFALYSILANLLIRNNNFLWLSTLIGTTAATILAYILHSKITWKERPISKTAKYKFFIWNFFCAFILSPLLTQLFSFISPLYVFAYNLSSALHLPFTYDFVLTTGAFVLTSCVTMFLNFTFYDKFVFGQPKKRTSK